MIHLTLLVHSGFKIYFSKTTDFFFLTPNVGFQRKKRVIYWWTDIFREKAEKSA